MLAGELDRQKRLKEEMKGNLQLTGLLTEDKLFQNYKQLQFIDTLADFNPYSIATTAAHRHSPMSR